MWRGGGGEGADNPGLELGKEMSQEKVLEAFCGASICFLRPLETMRRSFQ